MDFVTIGQIVAPRGLRGELRIALLDKEGRDLLHLQRVYLGEGRQRFAVRKTRLWRGQGLLQVEGIEDRETAEVWRNAVVCASTEDVAPLETDEYYYRQIIGLSARTTEGELLGRVTEVLATRANDVYVVRGAKGEILIPAIKDVVLSVDLQAGTMLIKLLDGLRE